MEKVCRQRRGYANLGIEEAFERIYATNAWGGQCGEFYSGPGSNESASASYVAAVRGFIEARHITSIVDLGCGDFRIGRRLLSRGLRYVGVDVVRPLIERNRRAFVMPNVSFVHGNIIEQEPPPGELGLLRQVLQHLSNAEIKQVLTKCWRYPWLIVTEHVPVGPDVIPNLDQPHGPDFRLYDRSGVFVDLPPFNLQATTLLETSEPPGVLRTVVAVGAPIGGLTDTP